MKKFVAIIISVLFILGTFACCGNDDTSGEIFKGITSTDLDGNEVNDEIFKGTKITMVNIWGTFCSPCINELPDLQIVDEHYGDDLKVIGIVSDVMVGQSTDEAKEIAVELCKTKYLHILDSESLEKAKLSTVDGVPLTLFLNEKGEVIKEVLGGRVAETWIEIIDPLMESVS